MILCSYPVFGEWDSSSFYSTKNIQSFHGENQMLGFVGIS